MSRERAAKLIQHLISSRALTLSTIAGLHNITGHGGAVIPSDRAYPDQISLPAALCDRTS